MDKNYNIDATFTNGSASEKRIYDAIKQKSEIEAKSLWFTSNESSSFLRLCKRIILYSLPISFLVGTTIFIIWDSHERLFDNETFTIRFLVGLLSEQVFTFMWIFVALTALVLFIWYLVKRKRYINLYVSNKIIEYLAKNE